MFHCNRIINVIYVIYQLSAQYLSWTDTRVVVPGICWSCCPSLCVTAPNALITTILDFTFHICCKALVGLSILPLCQCYCEIFCRGVNCLPSKGLTGRAVSHHTVHQQLNMTWRLYKIIQMWASLFCRRTLALYKCFRIYFFLADEWLISSTNNLSSLSFWQSRGAGLSVIHRRL